MNHNPQLDELFGKTPLRILLFFLSNPTGKFSQTELRKRIKLAKATATKWLKYLEDCNLVIVEKVSLIKLYRLNREITVIKYFKILYNLSIIAEIREIAYKFDCKAYLYGSAARGEDVEKSDIDILFIGKANKEQIIQEVNKLASIIKRQIKIEFFSEMEWSQMARKDPAFYERAEKDKIEI